MQLYEKKNFSPVPPVSPISPVSPVSPPDRNTRPLWPTTLQTRQREEVKLMPQDGYNFVTS